MRIYTAILRKTIWALGIGIAFVSATLAQSGKGNTDLAKIPVPQWHYQPEYDFDRPSDPAGWIKQDPGLHAAFGSTNERYLRCEIPSANNLSQRWGKCGTAG